MTKPVTFIFFAHEARQVSLVGEFNNWQPGAHPMQRQPDGAWIVQVPLHHGHHLYRFLVDGWPVLDPRAQGVGRDARNEPASVRAVS